MTEEIIEGRLRNECGGGGGGGGGDGFHNESIFSSTCLVCVVRHLNVTVEVWKMNLLVTRVCLFLPFILMRSVLIVHSGNTKTRQGRSNCSDR